ncbi:MAG: DUF2069 domain-containing protein [Xanthomonadales bacterium]|nr:DUF2069 domain-containing protein [Xanthomonadales bacterium]
MLAAYAATLAWQIIWHGLLPAPLGARNMWLAILACVPLLVPLAGLIRGKYRSMIWAGLLLMLYFTIGVMEAWSNPPQRSPALIQIILPIFYLFAFKMRNRNQS